MADFSVTGFIRQVKYLENACIVFVDEFKKGYMRPDGISVCDKYLSWSCVFKGYFKNFINNHFSNGMLVQIKGEICPYAINHGEMIDGYSVIGQTINIASYPRGSVKNEAKMIKESQVHSSVDPNLEDYMSPDF